MRERACRLIAAFPNLQSSCIRESVMSNKRPLGVGVVIGRSGDVTRVSGP